MRIKVLLFLLFVGLTSNYSQWECRSHLVSNLKPFYSGSKISWAAEISGSGGYVSSDPVTTSMGFLGLDFSNNNHQLYFEGGLKYWYRKDINKEYDYSKYLPGIRECSYSYISPIFNLKLGLQQFGGSDYFLLNERGLGASINKKFGDLNVSLDAASVIKSFARNGIFCSNCFIYDVVPSRSLVLGNYIGETNFAAVTVTKKAGQKAIKDVGGTAEDISDGFDEFDEIESTEGEKEKAKLTLESYGAILYSEFGKYYSNQMLHAGFMGEFSFWNAFMLKAEGLFQTCPDNNALVYFLKAERLFNWKSGNVSTLNMAYIGKYNLDGEIALVPRFSNLFYGEVYRMDLVDMPLINVSIKHQFTESKLSLKLQYSRQLKEQHLEELDFSIGKFVVNGHLRITMLSGAMRHSEMKGVTGMGRLEMRFFF